MNRSNAFSRRLRLKKIQTADPHAHYVEMDALRGIAILGVVLTHIAGQWKSVPSAFGGASPQLTIPFLDVDALNLFFLGASGLPALSTLGVNLFFVLSGYLLLWSEDERRRRGTYSVRSYALRRALRILPAYYFAIAIVSIRAVDSSVFSLEYIVKWVLLHLLFLYGVLEPIHAGGLVTYWYLNAEMFNYLLLPFVVAMLPRLWQRLALSGLLFVLSLSVQVYITQNGLSTEALESGSLNLWFLSRLPGVMFLFMAGGLLWMMSKRLGNRAQSRWRSLIASVLLLASVSLYASQPLFVAYPTVSMILREIAVIAFLASAVLGAPLLSRVLRWKPLAFIGVASYSMYLLDQITLEVVARYGILHLVQDWAASGGSSLGVWASFPAYALGVLVILFIISYLSYRYVESPFLRRKPT